MLTSRLAFIALATMMAGASTQAAATVVVTIDKSTQHMRVEVDNNLKWVWSISTGQLGHDTPNGRYTAFRMEADHFSKEWDDAPMPHSIFFTPKGHAIHGYLNTRRIGSPASHGCVRLEPANAARLYDLVEKEGLTNTKVVVAGDIRIALAHQTTPWNRAAAYRNYGAPYAAGYWGQRRPFGY
jgi:lipoprotein-anchoring transpeptidase ErfK/SrfK